MGCLFSFLKPNSVQHLEVHYSEPFMDKEYCSDSESSISDDSPPSYFDTVIRNRYNRNSCD
jgi:hypothetical protein